MCPFLHPDLGSGWVVGIVRIYTKKLLLQDLHLWYFIPSMVFSSFNFTTSAGAMQKFKSSKFQNMVVSLPVVSLTMNLKVNSWTQRPETSAHQHTSFFTGRWTAISPKLSMHGTGYGLRLFHTATKIAYALAIGHLKHTLTNLKSMFIFIMVQI